MKKVQLIITIIVISVVAISCNKENLYVVDSGKITSIIVVSDDYSAGIPTIQMSDSYVYNYTTAYTLTEGQLSSNGLFGVSCIDIKVNPSNASIDNVEWKIVRRSATTKALDNEEVFSGEITAIKSTTSPELVSLGISDSQNDFFVEGDGYVYSIVAVYDDSSEVTSDVACLLAGEKAELQSVFIGLEIDGVIVNYGDNFKMTSNSMIVDHPVMYGVLSTGEIKSFEELGIDNSQYTLQLTENTAGSTTSTLAINTLQCTDDTSFTSGYQWEIAVHERLEGYNYNEFNGSVNLQFEFSNLTDVIEVMDCTFYTEMDDLYLTKGTVISNDVSPFSFTVFCKNLDSDLLDRILMLYPYGDDAYSDFVLYYCNDDFGIGGLAYTPKFYIDDVETSDIVLDYSDSSNVKITLSNSLGAGVYEIKVVLSSWSFSTILTETTTLTVL